MKTIFINIKNAIKSFGKTKAISLAIISALLAVICAAFIAVSVFSILSILAIIFIALCFFYTGYNLFKE